MKTRFKGHETFFFREGWISKALYEMYSLNNDTLFSGNNGIVKLGVGSNMVKSIKYWMIACGLLEYDRKDRKFKLTTLGETIAKEDVYLENNFTLWLLHINLIRNYDEATTWNLFFNEFRAEEFDAKDVKNTLMSYLDSNEIHYSEKSLEADVNVLLSMYCRRSEFDDPEENITCPFSRLGLIKSNRRTYKKVIPDLDKVHALLVFYSILLLIEDKKIREKERYISITDLENGKNSISKLFNFNRILINEYLDQLSSLGYIRQEKTAGLDMVYITCEDSSIDVIQKYYRQEGMYES